MTVWTSEELDQVGKAEELEIASLRQDGTLRKPVTIWVVRLGDGLYVRSAYKRSAAWFRATQVRHEGRVKAGGIDKDVTFVDVNPAIDDQIDAAYRTKYHRHGAEYVNMVTTPEARSATLKLMPRAGGS